MLRFVGALSLVVLAFATPASADPRSEAMLRAFVAWVDSSPDWSASVSLVRSEGRDTLAEGLVFSRNEPHLSISIEELRLRDLAEREGDGFRASEMELRAGEIVGEDFDAKIPSAVASGASLPSLAGVVLDPKHLMRSAARFYSVAAGGALDELRIPEIVAIKKEKDASGVEVEVEIAYRNLLLQELAGGVLRRQEIGPVSVEARGPEPFSFEIEKIEVERTDLGAMAHILDETQYRNNRGDEVWRPLMSRALYRGLTATGPEDARVRIDEVAIENIDGRQAEEPFTSAWDAILDPATPDDAKNDLALEALSGMFRAFRVGTIRLDGMSVEAPKQATSMSLDGFTLTGWSSDGLDSFILKNLKVDAPQVHAVLGSIELSGFVSPDLKALMRFAAIEKDAEPATHAAAISETFAAMPRLDRFAIEGLVAGKSEEEAVSLDRLTLELRDWNKIFAGTTDFRIDNLKIPRALIELDPQAIEMLDALGYEDVTLGIALTDRWTPDIGNDTATWTVTVADAGDLELSYTLTGLTVDWLMRATAAAGRGKDSEAALAAMLRDLGLARATLSVTDRSLLDRAFGLVAQRQGVTIDGRTYREQMRAALPFIISAVIPVELAKRIAPPLQGFMAGGQTLFADIAPPTPLALLDVVAAAADPLTLPDRLYLTLRSGETKE